MQTGDGNECAARLAAQHGVDGVQRRADDVARGLVDAAPGRRVAGVEIAVAGRRAFAHQIDVRGRMKPFELFAGSRTRDAALDAPVESALVQFPHESFVPIGPERVAVAEAVARNLVARYQEHVGVGFRHGGPSWCCAPSPVPRLARGLYDSPPSVRPIDLFQPMAQFIYTMNRVGKVVPPKRVILRDISLSFFPG